jgi:hypothetical protein
LIEASKRKDRCLIAPKTLKAAAAQKVAAKLLKTGLVSEIKAKSEMEIWRRDEEMGQAYSLKLTVAGLKTRSHRWPQQMPNAIVIENRPRRHVARRDAIRPRGRSTRPTRRSAFVCKPGG